MKFDKNIDLILLANLYYVKCKIDDPTSQETELARNYLSKKIEEALVNEKNKSHLTHIEHKVYIR